MKKQEKEKGNNLVGIAILYLLCVDIEISKQLKWILQNDNDHRQVKNLLNGLRSSEKMKNLVECFQKYCNESVNELTKNEIMDLTPSSEFVLRYTDEDYYMQVLKETFESVDELFPESAIKFLNEFFSEVLFYTIQW